MDKRYEKKELLIKETFKQLLGEKYFERITVQELAAKAGIDRKTFYLHYDTLDNLLRSIQSDLATKFNERVKGLDPLGDLEAVTKEFFYFSNEEGKYYENITLNSEYYYMRNYLIKKVVTANAGNVQKNTERSFQIAFAVNTTLLFYSEWVRNNKQMSIDDIINLTCKTIKYGISLKN